MNCTFLDASLKISTILDVSEDAYLVVDLTTLHLLEWNLTFEKMGFEKADLHAKKSLYEKPFSPLFSGLKEVIHIQKILLDKGENPSNFAFLPLGKKGTMSVIARLVHVCHDEHAALVQVCIDTTLSDELAFENLERRDALLTATTKAAQTLLSEHENFDTTIDTVLGILGNATHVDRVYVWSIHPAPNPEEDTRLYTSQLYEWSEGAEPQQGNEIVTNMLVEEGIPTWIGTFLEGKCVNNLVKNMPQSEKDVLEPQGIVSILTAPIMFHGHLWGFIGFDNCHSEYTWSRAEEDILRTAGTLISTAIHSRRTNEALYRAQERFRGVEEATGDIIWSIDANHTIDYISPRLEAVLQYTPREIIGKPFNALLLHPEEFTCTATPENFIMRDVELRARCKDGTIKWLSSSCKYIFDDQGVLLYGFGSSSDITRVHDAQDALEIANKELEEAIKIANDLVESANKANAIKGNFLANMSHEIRTPMNAIVGITHLLRHTQLNVKQQEYIDKIGNSSVSLLSIINDILDFSKLQDGNMVIEKHVFTIKNLIKELKKTAAQWIDEKNLQFTVHIAPEVNTAYIGDVLRLNQILTSLTTNAIKFTHEGSIHIDIAVESENTESALLHFSVQDTGIGISQQDRETLFEGFTQADISSTRKYGGIGLGLALSRNLTILMGGDMWCTSQLGEGSTFHFTCRLEKSNPKRITEKKPLQNIHIAVAFPTKESADAVQEMLSPLGYTNIHFSKDIMAIKNALSTNTMPDIILLHEDFSETAIIESVLKNHPQYFNGIPIVYFYPKKFSKAHGARSEVNTTQIGPQHTHILTLNASSLHDAFVTLLGHAFKPDPSLIVQGFDEILRQKHSGKKVLLVEDNEINQMIAQSILEEVGLVVTVANDGVEGCELIYKDNFDLVIMDIQMPKMDGLTAAKQIRQDPQFDNIPIIAMTAHAMEEDREKSLNAGMNDHTIKPIDAPQLFKVLFYWLEERQSKMQ